MKRQSSVEGLVALGLMDRGDRRLSGDRRVEPFGEITEGVVAEAPGNLQGPPGARANQGFNRREGDAT